MRSAFPAGLALGVVLSLSVPVVGQSPSPSPSLEPCVTFAAAFAPGLTGLTVEAATATAASGGFSVAAIEVEDGDAEPGTVVSQDPAPGAAVDRSVAIAVSVAVAPVATPRPTKAPVDLYSLPFARLRAKAREPNYRTLFRNAEAFLGDLVYIKGRILQVVPGESSTADVLVQVTKDRFGFWDDIVWVYYTGRRLLPEDIVEIVGRAAEPVTYESAGQGVLTVPAVSAIQARRVR